MLFFQWFLLLFLKVQMNSKYAMLEVSFVEERKRKKYICIVYIKINKLDNKFRFNKIFVFR